MFEIGLVTIGSKKPIIIAELGINHGGQLSLAKRLAELAVESGADIVKTQIHLPEYEMSIEAKNVAPGNAAKSIWDVISENSLTLDEEFQLFEHIVSLGAQYLATPFSREAASFLNSIGVDGFKIGSGECSNYPFIDLVSDFGKPMIVSTGMNSLSQISKTESIITAKKVPLALMHTTNLYPTPHHLLRLGGVTELMSVFPYLEIGLSDHSVSNTAAVAAVAMGATFVERHFTDDKSRPGPDISCSMDTSDLRELRKSLDELFLALGGSTWPAEEEQVTRNFAFASAVATQDIFEGQILTLENIWLKRPSGGAFGPEEFPKLLGLRSKVRVAKNTQLPKEIV